MLLALSLLLVLPAMALRQPTREFGWPVVIGVGLALSAVTFVAYYTDKRRAQAGSWRIPESMLHLLALLGGWPGAFLAQHSCRHKTAKPSFQLIFWCIVLLHEFAALDSLMDWRLTKAALRSFT